MIPKISWVTYFEIVGVAALAYYLFVGLVFYRGDLAALAKRKTIPTTLPASDEAIPAGDMPMLQSVNDEVNAFLYAAKKDGMEKSQVLYSLQLLLGKYPLSNDTVTGRAAQSFVAEACESYCSIHLSEEEINVLFEG